MVNYLVMAHLSERKMSICSQLIRILNVRLVNYTTNHLQSIDLLNCNTEYIKAVVRGN